MTTVDKPNTIGIQTHELGNRKLVGYAPPKLLVLFSAEGIEGKDPIIPTETGTIGTSGGIS